ncbi:hypothetical protein [Humisphaera borealis]|uniref:Uncharacterized protein n=1 Tax=Humisphaera borealis TaxID=2807512 RepID=A0A7M2X127_9BACT|nr:hypothetical protein [Humisphaera borealis]QOV90440.1 hypothetical protein IPV69_03475 [Humisphaera borealis]
MSESDVTGNDIPISETSSEATAPAGSLAYSTGDEHSIPDQAPVGRLDVAVIGMRLLATYFVATSAPALVTYPFLALSIKNISIQYELVRLAPSLAGLAIGMALWFIARPAARWMLRDVSGLVGAPRARLSAAHAQSLAFSVLGLALGAYACRHVATIGIAVTAPGIDGMVQDKSALLRESGIDLFVEGAVASGIFFGARGIAYLWHRARATN